MGVKNVHTAYSIMKPIWEKCLDFMESESAVKARGELYLPALGGQEPAEYDSYRGRTSVSMLAQRSKKAMCGMITRKDAYITGVKQIEELLKSIDTSGSSFGVYTARFLADFLCTGRGATLVEVPLVTAPITVAQAEVQGVRPRVAYYGALDILNWKTTKVANLEVLSLVVLRELVNDEDSTDEFAWDEVYQYRVLDLKDGFYRQRLFNEAEEQVGADIYPKMNNTFMRAIPIEIHGGVNVQIPPLDQIVDLNLHHYQLSADEIHGLRWTALPTPYLFGMDPDDPNYPSVTGPTQLIASENEAASTGFREFSGAGLEKVANKLLRYEETIAMLSVQMATEQINKSATGSAIDYSSSTSSLAGIVTFLSAELTKVLKVVAEWAGKKSTDITCELNKDFAPVSMTPALLSELFKQYVGGGISYATYYKNLAQGEITDPHKEPEEELREIEENIPPGLVTDGAGNEETGGEE